MYKCNNCGLTSSVPLISIDSYDGRNTKPQQVHFCSNQCYEQYFGSIYGITQDRQIKGGADYFLTRVHHHTCVTVLKEVRL